ncbi:hypothetical protein [Kitasatospora fiedleri]|uniref:hypothetical protein n=1 Tax=Kitasatospora fiedleri TaxID=2991545 RepID=UPI00249A75DF|nr:hypothetical protein [Kitasatospora fiedleri]
MNPHEGLPDDRLDALLRSVAADLFQHVTATTGTGPMLDALMAAEQSSSGPALPLAPEGSALITVRAVARNLGLIHDLAEELAEVGSYSHDPHLRGAARTARGLMEAIIRVSGRPALEYTERFEVRRSHDDGGLPFPDRTDHGEAHRWERRLVEEVKVRSADLAERLVFVEPQVSDAPLFRQLWRALDEHPGIAEAISVVDSHPAWTWAGLCRLASRQVDASGADLTHLDVRVLNVLANVLWSDATRWPSRLEEHVRACSEELRPGVYLVGGGTAREDVGLGR